MKITKSYLKQIIKEEYSFVMDEASGRIGFSPVAIFPEIFVVVKNNKTVTLKEVFSSRYRLNDESKELIKKKIIKDNDFLLKNAASKLDAVEKLEPSLKYDEKLGKIISNIKNPRQNIYLHLSDYQIDNKIDLLKKLFKTDQIKYRPLNYFNKDMESVLGMLNLYEGDTVEAALKNALESFESASNKK